MNTIKVFFFGDSVCVGQHVSIHKGWVTRISAEFSEFSEARGCQVIVSNASASGRTTRQALEQMPYEIQSQFPDVLIVQFGMNDCNYWQSDQGVPRVSPGAFEANLEEIVGRALAFGVKTVCLNTNHPTGRDQKNMPHTTLTYQQSLERYNQIIRDVAARGGSRVVLNDIERVFRVYAQGDRAKLLELVLPGQDLLHPSEKGHELYFNAIYPVLMNAVSALIARPSP
jgi:lysophospholipase L1-like esterase